MKTLDQASGVPKYIQIRETLREEIESGRLGGGQQIPPENDLANHFGVSRLTVRHGLEDLIQEGIIYKEHGLGTFVSPASVQANYSRLTSFTKDVKDQGKKPSAKLLDIVLNEKKQDISSKMGLPNDTVFVCISRVRFADEKPVAIQHSFVPEELAPISLDSYDWSKQSLFSLMEQKGIIAKRAIEKISACLAQSDHVDALDLEIGDPLIYIERITFGAKGRPIEYVEMYNRPDRYECTVQLKK